MTKDTGGPAFPSTYPNRDGMTLRDWFAGQALAGILADPNGPWQGAAERSYYQADAMLAERSKP